MARILFIDDDWIALNIYKRASQILGHEAVMVASGKSAVETAAGYDPDLIMLDMVLPDMDGVSILKALRQQDGLQTIPILILTSGVSLQDADIVKAAGANGYISKPISLDLLQETITRYTS